MAVEVPLPTQLLAVLNAGGQHALARTIGDLAHNWLAEHGWADHLSELDFTTYQDHYSLPPRGWPVAPVAADGLRGSEPVGRGGARRQKLRDPRKSAAVVCGEVGPR